MPPAIGAALIGGIASIGGGLLASSGASKAANAQSKSDAAAIAEQRRQYDLTRSDFAPYLTAGKTALPGIMDLLGLGRSGADEAAIASIKASPEYSSLYNNGLETLMQNASATGGLRGGNTQAGLLDFGRDTLSQMIGTRLSRLGGLAGMGQGATDSVSALGARASDNISGLFQAQGNAQASSALTQAGVWSGVMNNLGSLITKAAYPHGGF